MANPSYTLQQSISFAQTFIQYSPLAVGTGNEPALSLANEIQNMIVNPPFCWGWNRGENSTYLTTAQTQDVTCAVTDFSFLEKVSLTGANGVVYQILDVYNNAALAKADTTAVKCNRPNAACVTSITYGTSFKLRFMPVPDAAYTINLVYQKLVTPLSTLTGATGTWAIPDQYLDIYNNLFVGEAMANVDDSRANQYRQRGVAALIAKSEGLSEMQINAFLAQYWARTSQGQYKTLRTQQGAQAGAI